MSALGIVITVDLIIAWIVVIWTVNYLRLQEDEEAKKPSEPKEPEKVMNGTKVTRRFVDVYRDKDGWLHRDLPKYEVKVESELPEGCIVPMNKITVVRTIPDKELVAYICEGDEEC